MTSELRLPPVRTAARSRPGLPAGRLVALVVTVGVVITVLAAWTAQRAVDQDEAQRFDRVAADVVEAVRREVATDANSLTQLRNAVLVDLPLTRQRFHELVTLGLDDELYGRAVAVGFNEVVPLDRTVALEEQVRADRSVSPDGYPGFSVFPADAPDPRYVVTMLEPLEGNEGAFGFDLGSDPARRLAVETARDRGDIVATAPIDLVQRDDAPGFLMFSAIYDTGDVPVTAPARRRHFAGVLVLVFGVDDLIGDVFAGHELDAEIYDVGLTIDPAEDAVSADGLLLDTDPSTSALDGHEAERAVDLNVGDRRWRVFLDRGDRYPARTSPLPFVLLVSGTVITALLARVVNDIGRDRERAQLLAGRMTEDLVATEVRLRRIIDQAPDATLLVASDGTIELANQQVTRMFGWDAEELVGEPIETLLPMRARGVHVHHREAYTDDPHTRQMGADLDLVALHRDGTEIPVEVSLGPLRTASGDLQVIASVRDVSIQRDARRTLEASLEREQQAAERLRETDRLRTAFLGTVSHELRTPLAAITGFVSTLLERREELPPALVDDLLRRVARNATTLGDFIGDLLDFTRLERGMIEVDLEPLDVGATVREIVDQLDALTASHEVVTVAADGIVAMADRHALTRVVTNLLTNAVRYSPEGSRVAISVVEEAGAVTIRVSDQGRGIAPEDRQLVFERFYRGEGDEVVRHVGAGIGLSVVKDLVTQMGGLVHIESSADGGASFVVTLAANHRSRRGTD